MSIASRSEHNTPQNLIDEYLNNGGQITVCAPGARTENIENAGGFYKNQKKKPKSSDVVADDES